MVVSETCLIAISFKRSLNDQSLWQWRNVVSREILRGLCFIVGTSLWVFRMKIMDFLVAFISKPTLETVLVMTRMATCLGNFNITAARKAGISINQDPCFVNNGTMAASMT